MAADLCRKGLHPASDRYVYPSGRIECRSCGRDRKRARYNAGECRIVAPATPSAWTVPVTDTDRQARYEAWAATVDGAIARLRAAEGFDGNEREWRTLGDVVGMRASVQAAQPAEVVQLPDWRRVATCSHCGGARFNGSPCATCAMQRQPLRRQVLGRMVS